LEWIFIDNNFIWLNRNYFLNNLQPLFFKRLYIWSITLLTAMNQTVSCSNGYKSNGYKSNSPILQTAILQVLYLQRLYFPFSIYVWSFVNQFLHCVPSCPPKMSHLSRLDSSSVIWWRWRWSWGNPYCITQSAHSISSSPCSYLDVSTFIVNTLTWIVLRTHKNQLEQLNNKTLICFNKIIIWP
jgi:hypothetical protein